MASEQQLRDVRMACLFGDEFRRTDAINSNEVNNSTLLDILRPGLEAQRAQVIANLTEHESGPNVLQKPIVKDDASDGSIEDMASIASIYDFIDKEYDCIQQYSGASTCAGSTTDLLKGRSSSGTRTSRSAYTDTYSSTSYTGTVSVFSGSADSAIGMDKINASKHRDKDFKVPECRSDMLQWKDLDIGEGMGVVCMPNGNVAVSDFETHDIVIYNDLGIRVSSSQEGGLKLSCPRGLAYHPQESGLLVAEWTKGRLLMLSSDARRRLRRINVAMRPFGVAVLSNGDLVVVGMFKLHGTWSGGAAIIDLKGKERKRWRGGLDKPWHVVVGPRDLIYVSDFRSHCIMVFTAEGRKVRCIKGGPDDDLTFPKGLCLLNDLILVCHDITSVSGGKTSRLTAWTRHGRYLGVVLNWPNQTSCRLRGIAVHGDILVAVGNYKVMTYKLIFRDVTRMSMSSQSQQSLASEADGVYDETDSIYKKRQQTQLTRNRTVMMNHHNHNPNHNHNASKIQRVIPFVRSPCDTISENDYLPKKDLQRQILPLDRLPPLEPGDLRGPLLLDTPQPNLLHHQRQLQDNPNVIYQRGIKYFRGYTSGRKTTYNPIYSPADYHNQTNPTPDLSDDQEDQRACMDFDANTPDVRKSYMTCSQGSFYSSQPNLNCNSPDPWIYQSQTSIATRSEPYSQLSTWYYDMKPNSPAYIDLHSIRHTTLPRSPFNVAEAANAKPNLQPNLQPNIQPNIQPNLKPGLKPNLSHDSTLPYQVSALHAPPSMQPTFLKRHILSPSAHFLPPTAEVEDQQHPIDMITELYDDIWKQDDEEQDDIYDNAFDYVDNRGKENNGKESRIEEREDGKTNTNTDNMKTANPLPTVKKHDEDAAAKVANVPQTEYAVPDETLETGPAIANNGSKIPDVPPPPKPPHPPPLIGKVLRPSLRKKGMEGKKQLEVTNSTSSHGSNSSGRDGVKPTPPPVPKKPAVNKARLNLKQSASVTSEDKFGDVLTEMTMLAKHKQKEKGKNSQTQDEERGREENKACQKQPGLNTEAPKTDSDNKKKYSCQKPPETRPAALASSSDDNINAKPDPRQLQDDPRLFQDAPLKESNPVQLSATDRRKMAIPKNNQKHQNMPTSSKMIHTPQKIENTHNRHDQINQKSSKQAEDAITDDADNLETTRRLLSYTPSSPAQALAKILKASVAKPAWEIDTTDDERVNSVLDSIIDTEDEIDERNRGNSRSGTTAFVNVKPQLNGVRKSTDEVVHPDEFYVTHPDAKDDRAAVKDGKSLIQEVEDSDHDDAFDYEAEGPYYRSSHETDDQHQKAFNDCNGYEGSHISSEQLGRHDAYLEENLYEVHQPESFRVQRNNGTEQQGRDKLEDQKTMIQDSIEDQSRVPVRKTISPTNTIQRGKPNTYQGKPVIQRTRLDSPYRVDSFENNSPKSNEKNFETSTPISLVAPSPDFPPPPSPASLDSLGQHPEQNTQRGSQDAVPIGQTPQQDMPETSKCQMGPAAVVTKPPLSGKTGMASIQKNATNGADPAKIDAAKNTAGKIGCRHLRNVLSPPPNHPPPSPITPANQDRFLQTPDLPPPPLPNSADMFAAKSEIQGNRHNRKDQMGYIEAIPISRVTKKPVTMPFSPSPGIRKPPKCKQSKMADQPKRKIGILHTIIRKAFHHKSGGQTTRGCAVSPKQNTHSKLAGVMLKSPFRHSFCNTRLNQKNEADHINEKDRQTNKETEKTQSNEAAESQKKRQFQRRNTICGISVLKAAANQANAGKNTGVRHSEV